MRKSETKIRPHTNMGIECVDYEWILYVKYDGEDKNLQFFCVCTLLQLFPFGGKNQNDNA